VFFLDVQLQLRAQTPDSLGKMVAPIRVLLLAHAVVKLVTVRGVELVPGLAARPVQPLAGIVLLVAFDCNLHNLQPRQREISELEIPQRKVVLALVVSSRQRCQARGAFVRRLKA
jgi:hypothetical protein